MQTLAKPDTDLERLGDQIAALAANLDAATAALLDMIREFDAGGGWGSGSGFLSCAHWLSHRTNVGLGTAREQVRVARALGTLPRLAEALACGQLSYAKVRAITRVATPETEDRLLRIGRKATACELERIVRAWRVDRDEEGKAAERHHANRSLRVYHDDDGSVVIHGRLAPEAGAVLLRALEAAGETIYQRGRHDDDPPTTRQQQADALVLLAEAALRHELNPGAPGDRYQVVVHVDAPVLADADHPGQSTLEDGTHVSAETSQRLACDASRVVMRRDRDGNILEVGARTRTIPPALRRALVYRDRRCRFPGCQRRFGDGHHIQHWAQGGPTTLSNLVILCRRHHRSVHEEGFMVEREADGALAFRTRQGRLLPNISEPAAISADPVASIREASIASSRPSVCHEPFDLGQAIDVLYHLAIADR